MQCTFLLIPFCLVLRFQYTWGIVEFPTEIPLNIIKNFPITEDQFRQAIQLGVESEKLQQRLEENLVSYNIKVTNGSISHAQFLETFPNEEARRDDWTARKILKATQFLNTHCKLLNLNSCATYFSTVQLPVSELKDECLRITGKEREGHHAFRRLLPANYRDGFYEMVKDPEVPKPRVVSQLAAKIHPEGGAVEEDVNLILVQWAQFIEHDLSKSAVTTMADGTPIECCNSDFYKLKPRYVHPSCAPLEGVPANAYDRISCLNYVRSALAVDPECEFGPAQQLNQATNSLDLSQLYGHTSEPKNRIRTFVGGQLKTSEGDLLPLAESKEQFCALTPNSNKRCFMAGDNRVNSNPFMNFIYTLFLRSHNNIAEKLRRRNPGWNDEGLYTAAKSININIYRSIIFNEWLPLVLGEKVSTDINRTSADIFADGESGISNEFAVAAIRFYYSMMPDALLGAPMLYQSMLQSNVIVVDTNPSMIAPERLFSLQEQFYKSDFLASPRKLEIALEAMLEQRALKMDSQYAESLIKYFLQTDLHLNKNVGSDALAWDIQRSRDHGLAGYVEYLEVCAQTSINDWNDLRTYIRDQDIDELKRVYGKLDDIDLIVGGISEKPANDSLLGPTFTCILGEQFSRLKKFQELNSPEEGLVDSILGWKKDTKYTGAKLLCETTTLETVPQRIFLAPSKQNRLVSCSSL